MPMHKSLGHASVLFCKGFLNLSGKRVCHVLGITKKHLRVLLEKHRVLNICIAARHGTLHVDAVLGIPHLQDRHAVDRAALCLLGSTVGDVVGTDHEGHVGVREVVVDLIHLQHPIVGNACLCKKHIHLTWHTSCHRVNAKAHLDVCVSQCCGNISHGCLRASHSHTVTRHNDDTLGLGKHARHAISGGFYVLLGWACIFINHFGCSIHATKDHIAKVAVHCITHDNRQDAATECDQRPNDCENGGV
mmetsp:Transcript_18943/g.35697  ORF Transcript_18943/g.35697 Transcript_18943/m.35697 type:complete len:247 (-) Transcript_18943:637-1377(-)